MQTGLVLMQAAAEVLDGLCSGTPRGDQQDRLRAEEGETAGSSEILQPLTSAHMTTCDVCCSASSGKQLS